MKNNKKLFCTFCGADINKDDLFCVECGAKCGAKETPPQRQHATPKRRFSVKGHVAVIAAALTLSVAGISTAVAVNADRYSVTTEKSIALAERYLAEMNYEQAIIEFDKVIDMDMYNADAYLGKAKALIALGRTDEAIDVLETGYELTKDQRLLDLLELLKEPDLIEMPLAISDESVEAELPKEGAIKLIWTDLEAEIDNFGFGHYVRKDGELYGFADIDSSFISSTRYKDINYFFGNDTEHYCFATTTDDRYVVLDKELNEIFDYTEYKDKIAWFNEKEPLLLLHGGILSTEPYLTIYKPDGKIVYHWKQGQNIDGSGTPATLDSPLIPDEYLTYTCSNEYHQDLWVEEFYIGMGEYSTAYTKDDNAYIVFEISVDYDYDRTAEQAAWDAEDEQRKADAIAAAIANGSDYVWWSPVSRNTHGHYQWGYVCYKICYSNNKVSLEIDKEPSNSGNYIVLKATNEYTIGRTQSPWDKGNYFVLTQNGNEYYLPIGGAYSYDYSTKEKTMYTEFEYYRFITDKFVYGGKALENDPETDEYAFYSIEWNNTWNWDEVIGESSDYENYSDYEKAYAKAAYKGFKRISEKWYDSILWSDTSEKFGIYGVISGDKEGYFSVTEQRELGMFDTRSVFSLDGYAVVSNDGKGWIIDTDGNPVTEEFPCDGGNPIGNKTFVIYVGDQYKLLVLDNY